MDNKRHNPIKNWLVQKVLNTSGSEDAAVSLIMGSFIPSMIYMGADGLPYSLAGQQFTGLHTLVFFAVPATIIGAASAAAVWIAKTPKREDAERAIDDKKHIATIKEALAVRNHLEICFDQMGEDIDEQRFRSEKTAEAKNFLIPADKIQDYIAKVSEYLDRPLLKITDQDLAADFENCRSDIISILEVLDGDAPHPKRNSKLRKRLEALTAKPANN